MVDHGKRIVFDPVGSYIQDVKTGLTEPINRVGNTFEFDTYFWDTETPPDAVTKPSCENTNNTSGFPRQAKAI